MYVNSSRLLTLLPFLLIFGIHGCGITGKSRDPAVEDKPSPRQFEVGFASDRSILAAVGLGVSRAAAHRIHIRHSPRLSGHYFFMDWGAVSNALNSAGSMVPLASVSTVFQFLVRP